MKRATHKLMAILVLGLITLQVSAQIKAHMFGLGRTNLLDTYLSPQNYYGTDLRYITHRITEKDYTRFQHRQLFMGEISLTKPKSEDGKQISGMIYYSYGWLWQIVDTYMVGRFHMHAGGAVDSMLGFIYNTKNGNNPAQAKLALNLSPIIDFDYYIPHTLMKVNYEISAPLVGLLFSPNYGQSYYEIFSRGDYDHNIVPTTIGTTPTLRHLLTLDIPYSNKTTFRIGYMGDYQQAKVNNLKYHARTHSFVIGMVF